MNHISHLKGLVGFLCSVGLPIFRPAGTFHAVRYEILVAIGINNQCQRAVGT